MSRTPSDRQQLGLSRQASTGTALAAGSHSATTATTSGLSQPMCAPQKRSNFNVRHGVPKETTTQAPPAGGRRLSRELRSAITFCKECTLDGASGRVALREVDGSMQPPTPVSEAGIEGMNGQATSEVGSFTDPMPEAVSTEQDPPSTEGFVTDEDFGTGPSDATLSLLGELYSSKIMEPVAEIEEEVKEEVLLLDHDQCPAEGPAAPAQALVNRAPASTPRGLPEQGCAGSTQLPSRSHDDSFEGLCKVRCSPFPGQTTMRVSRRSTPATSSASTLSESGKVQSARQRNSSSKSAKTLHPQSAPSRSEELLRSIAGSRSCASSRAPSGASTPKAALEPRSMQCGSLPRARSVERLASASSSMSARSRHRGNLSEVVSESSLPVKTNAATAIPSTPSRPQAPPGRQITVLVLDPLHVVAGYDCLADEGGAEEVCRQVTRSAATETRCQVWPVDHQAAKLRSLASAGEAVPPYASLLVRGVHKQAVSALAVASASTDCPAWFVSASSDCAVAWHLDGIWKSMRRANTHVECHTDFEGIAWQADASGPLIPVDTCPATRSCAVLFKATRSGADQDDFPQESHQVALGAKQVDIKDQTSALHVALMIGADITLFQVMADLHVTCTASLNIPESLFRCFMLASSSLTESPCLRLVACDDSSRLFVWPNLGQRKLSQHSVEPWCQPLLSGVNVHCLAVSATSWCERCYVGSDSAIVQMVDLSKAPGGSALSSVPTRVRLAGVDAAVTGLHSLARPVSQGDTIVALLADGGIYTQDLLTVSGETVLDGSASHIFNVTTLAAKGILAGAIGAATSPRGDGEERARVAWSEPGTSTVRVALLPGSKDTLETAAPPPFRKQASFTITRSAARRTTEVQDGDGALPSRAGSTFRRSTSSQPPPKGARPSGTSSACASRKASPSRAATSPRTPGQRRPSASASASATPRGSEGGQPHSARGKDPSAKPKVRQEGGFASPSKLSAGRRGGEPQQPPHPAPRDGPLSSRENISRQQCHYSSQVAAKGSQSRSETRVSKDKDNCNLGGGVSKAVQESHSSSTNLLPPAVPATEAAPAIVGAVPARAALDPSSLLRPVQNLWEPPQQVNSGQSTPKVATSPTATARPCGTAVGMYTTRSGGPVLFAKPQLTFRATSTKGYAASPAIAVQATTSLAPNQGLTFSTANTTGPPSSYFSRASPAVLFASSNS